MDSISIVIPAYNEAKRLPGTLQSISAFLDRSQFRFSEVIVVNDGSFDGTKDLVLAKQQNDIRFRLVSNPGNRGKGFAVRNGMLQAKGDWVLFSDADLSTPIEEVEALYRAATQNNALIAIGSRALKGSTIDVHQSAFRELSGKSFNLFMRLITGLPYQDSQCGFKLYRHDAALQIFSRQTLDGFSFDVEDLCIASFLQIPAVEVPVRWSNVEGTTVSTMQGLRSFLDVLLIRIRKASDRYR